MNTVIDYECPACACRYVTLRQYRDHECHGPAPTWAKLMGSIAALHGVTQAGTCVECHSRFPCRTWTLATSKGADS